MKGMKLSELLERHKKIEDKIKRLKSEKEDIDGRIYNTYLNASAKLCSVFEKKFNYGFHRVQCNCGVSGSGNAFILLCFYDANNNYCTRILTTNAFDSRGSDEKLAEFDEKYTDRQNRKALMHQITRLNNLYSNTDYLHNLPLAYTFILSSPFCRNITKLIATKILFFKIEKRKRSKDGQNDG